MTTEQIILYISALLPSLSALITIVTVGIKIWKKFRELRADMKDKTESEELKRQLERNLEETKELKALLKKDIQSRTHIRED